MCPTCVVWPDSPLASRLVIQTSSAGFCKGQRSQEQLLTTLKTVDAGADPEPGDQDGECGEAGVASQRPRGVPQILEKVVESHGCRLDGEAVLGV